MVDIKSESLPVNSDDCKQDDGFEYETVFRLCHKLHALADDFLVVKDDDTELP